MRKVIYHFHIHFIKIEHLKKLNIDEGYSYDRRQHHVTKEKIGQTHTLVPKFKMPRDIAKVAPAYSEKDFLMNQDIEREMMKEIQGVFETNDYLTKIDKVFSLLDYNYSTIRSNIRCGMVTNWKEIMEELDEVYKKVLLKIQKTIQTKKMEYLGNGSNADTEFMNLCFIYNHCETSILHFVYPIIALCDEYSSVVTETLTEKSGLPEALGLEISGW